MRITGAHSIIYTTNADADRAFLRDVLKLPNIDVGEGWLIFGLPPAEVAVHPAENTAHELYLMCDDVEAFVSEMTSQGLPCETVEDRGWGLLTTLTLPGGGKLGVYEPRHARPEAASGAKAGRAKASQRAGGTTSRQRANSRRAPVRAKAPARAKTSARGRVSARPKAPARGRGSARAKSTAARRRRR
jgi:hypothetical protein